MVLLPLVGVLGFLLKTAQGEASGAAMLASAAVVFLSCVLAVGVVRMARTWDGEAER